MNCYMFIACFLCIATEISTLKLYVITTNNDKKSPILTEKLMKFLLNIQNRDKLRSEFESRFIDKNKCDRHFGSIFGTKAQKTLCLENYYEERKLRNDLLPFKRKRKQSKLPIRKPFADLTRGLITQSFSADYLDMKDFVRSMDSDEFSNDYLDVGDLARDDSIEPRRAWPYETKYHKNLARFRAEDSDSSEDSDDDTQNRFQIIDNKSSESDSESMESDESKEAKLLYFQGRNRLVKDYDGRKRLQHFLPKRFHWDEGDIKNLGYYWFNGPRGRFAEAVNLY